MEGTHSPSILGEFKVTTLAAQTRNWDYEVMSRHKTVLNSSLRGVYRSVEPNKNKMVGEIFCGIR